MIKLLKELSEGIEEFKQRVEKSREKVTARLKKMDDEISEVEEKLILETKNMLNAELEDNKAAADKSEDLITEIQGKLAIKIEKRALVEKAMNQIELFDPKDIEKIKKLSVQTQSKVNNALVANRKQMDEIDKKIDQLNLKKKQLSDRTIGTISYNLIVSELYKIGGFIVPDIDKIQDHIERRQKIRHWLEQSSK